MKPKQKLKHCLIITTLAILFNLEAAYGADLPATVSGSGTFGGNGSPVGTNVSTSQKLLAAIEKDPRVQSNGLPWRFAKASATDPKLPRVLLVGDSILNGYLPYAIKLFNGKANVDAWVNPYFQSEVYNKLLAEVLDDNPYDVVFFNIGLHGWEKGRIKEGTFEPLTKDIVEVIRKKCPKAQIIWASITPVTVKGEPGILDSDINPIIVQQNRMAAKVMNEMHVPIEDFYSLLANKLDLARGDQFHWTTPAYKILADACTKFVIQALSKKVQSLQTNANSPKDEQ